MNRAYVDANVILRFLTGDPPEMAEPALELFAAADAGELALIVDDIVVAEIVWVLGSFYKYPATEIGRTLQELLAHDAILVDDRSVLAEALNLFVDHNVDFADALVAARMRRRGMSDIYSFDTHFDRLPGIKRVAPGWAGQ